jgi:hypothetical protein
MATQSKPAPSRATRGTRVEPPQPQPQPDPQTVTEPAGELYEVLTELQNGHRTVTRVWADSRSAAEKTVTDELPEGVQVLGVALAGTGLGSG